MSPGERQLAALASVLIGNPAGLTPAERKLVLNAPLIEDDIVRAVRARILAGDDPLGNEFCTLRNRQQRREHGATYTPFPIVDAMVEWAEGEATTPSRVVDPGAGSGRFLIVAAKKFPQAQLIAIEIDPLAALMLRANAAVHGVSNRLSVHVADYRALDLPEISGPTLFIGNPPYVRHHDIPEQWKCWLGAAAASLQLKASKLAGLHVHFFLKTRQLARAGDFGAFITAAEWLDVNYGSVVRDMLADGLGGTAVHVVDPKALPFLDALTTAAITCFRVGDRPSHAKLRSVHRIEDLAPLGQGRAVAWNVLAKAPRWSHFVRETPPPPSGFIELGELFRVHRGQVTGANKVWIAGEMARLVPARFKKGTVTGARELIAAGPELASVRGLKKVVDLPVSLGWLEANERRNVGKFLEWAKSLGAADGYIAQHRRAWWAVGLRPPAPILCTYMARRAPAFVLNSAGARHLNIAHGLYPRGPLSERELRAILAWLRGHVGMAGGRVYAGGLVKFEPKELERIPIPPLEEPHVAVAEEMDHSRAGGRRCRGDGDVPACSAR